MKEVSDTEDGGLFAGLSELQRIVTKSETECLHTLSLLDQRS
jgi:hypothetical protein